MPDNVLSAKITADGREFTKTVAQLEAQLKAFQTALKNTSSVESFNRINRAIEATKSRLQALNTIKDPLKGVTQGSNAATLALTNTGRVAQDLPFGFLGIANNLNPLLESFQRLKAETGSTGGALKALGASLTGAGGIGFALSVVSSLLIVFGDKLFGAAAASKASEQALAGYKDQLDAVKKSVDALSDSLQFANQLGSINIKIRGAKELADLSEQSIAQQQQTFDLKQQREELFKIEQQIVQDQLLNNKDMAEAKAENAKVLDDINKKITESEQKQSILYRTIALQRVEDQREANKKAKEDYDKYVNDTISKAKELASFLDSRTIRNVQFTIDPRDSLQKVFKEAQAFLDKASNRFTSFAYKINVFPQINFEKDRPDLFKDLPKQTEELQKKLQKEIDALTARNPIIIASQKFDFDRRQLVARAEALATQLDAAIKGAFQNAFVGLAEIMGDALSGQDIGASLFNLLGDLIAQIGKALIQFGIAMTGAQKVIKAGFGLPGAVAIAIGAAAIAAAQLVKNLKPSGARASGGAVNAGQGYYVGEKGTELFVPNTAGRIVPNNVLAGNTGRMQRQAVVVEGQFVVRGTDLVAALSAANRSGRRLN